MCIALSTSGEKESAFLYHLSLLIAELTTSRENAQDIVWICSNCGLEGKEEADKLAKAALGRPLRDELMVPVEFGDVNAAIRSRTKKNAEDIDKFPQGMHKHWNLRKARVILNQLYTGFCAPLSPMRHIL